MATSHLPRLAVEVVMLLLASPDSSVPFLYIITPDLDLKLLSFIEVVFLFVYF